MSEFFLQPDALRKSALDFDQAGKDLTVIVKSLDASTAGLEKQWQGVSRQLFFKQYQELRGYLEAFSSLTTQISNEMKAMADRYDEADH